MLVLLTSTEHLEAFQNFLNGQRANMAFTTENEKQYRLSFLDVDIICEDKTFTISVELIHILTVFTIYL